MSLNYRTLETKPTVTTSDGETMQDIYALNYIGGQTICTYIGVTKDYVARPDLISLAVYETDQYADIICKYNGISNPFELNEGMILQIPYLSAIPSLYASSVQGSEKTDDTDEITSPQTGYQKKVNERRSPNELTVGEQNFWVDENIGFVIY